MDLPFRISYSSLAATVASVAELTCDYSDLFKYYSLIRKVETVGITDLESYFYEKAQSITHVDHPLLRSHLVSLEDEN